MSNYDLTTDTSLSDLEEIGKKNKMNIIVVNQYDLKYLRCKSNGLYIFNINPKSNSGHWTACIIKNNYAFYLDSFGVIPSIEIINFFKSSKAKWYYNKNDIQNIDDVTCGYFCLAYLHYMKSNPSAMRMNEFTRMFFNDTNKNNKVLKLYLEKHFD